MAWLWQNLAMPRSQSRAGNDGTDGATRADALSSACMYGLPSRTLSMIANKCTWKATRVELVLAGNQPCDVFQ